MADMSVTFRGVRGSHAMPGPTTIRYGGNTTCVEVRAGDQLIILDAGTGIISLGKEMMAHSRQASQPIRCTMLLTHMHHDHNQGLPFFSPMYVSSSRIYMFGPEPLEENIGTVLFQSPYFPVELRELPALKFLQSVVLSDAILFEDGVPRLINSSRATFAPGPEDVYVRILRAKAHPHAGVFVYRVHYRGKSVTFATDLEGYVGGDTALIRFAHKTDLLIHDAMYSMEDYVGSAETGTRQGFGHSTPEMAIDTARRCGADQLACTHHDPDYTDDRLDEMERGVRAQFANSFLAREGMTINL